MTEPEPDTADAPWRHILSDTPDALIFADKGGPTAHIFVMLLQMATFLVKITMMIFVYIWVRWTLPRFRYDQLQRLGWQTLLPLALLNIFVTSACVVALS